MKQAIEIETDFGATMHELSAEAITSPARCPDPEPSGMTALIGAVYALNQRMESLEESVVRKFETRSFREDRGATLRHSRQRVGQPKALRFAPPGIDQLPR